MTALSGSQFKPPSLPEVTDFALKNLVLWARIFTCAWHDAQSELPVLAGSHKTPAVTGRKGNANKARAGSRNGPSGGSMRQNPCT